MNSNVDILLVPPITNPVFSEEYETFMPLGLLALSANLVKYGYSCHIYHPEGALFDKNAYQEVSRKIINFNPCIIGFSTWCHSYPSALIISKQIKKISPETYILFGGPQASLLPIETLSAWQYIDFIMVGESDNTLISFMEEFEIQKTNVNPIYKTPSLVYRDANKNIVANAPGKLINNLNDLPIPQYDIIKSKNKTVSLDVGRGCPFKCTFCTTNNFFSKSYRVKSIDRIIQEMDHLWLASEVTSFDFTHDMFTFNKRFVTNLCTRLISHEKEYNRGYKWTCSARVDCVTDELLEIMRDAGCQGVFFGIETGSPRLQRIIKKNLKIENGFDVISKCSKIGLSCSAAFIAGFPDETRDDLDQTLNAVLKTSVLGAKSQISLLSLLPQTPLYEAYKNDLLLDNHATDFTGGVNGYIERKLITKFPELFSSFYYLPVDSVSRKTLININVVVNNIGKLFATLKLIWPTLVEYLYKDRVSLLEYVEDRIDDGDPLNSFVRAVSEFISNHKYYLPDIIEDVFAAEVAGMFVCKRFLTSQLLDRRQLSWGEFTYQNEKWMVPTNHWTVLKTNYPIQDMVFSIIEDKYNHINKNLSFTLVVAKNEREAAYYSVREWQLNLLKELKESLNVGWFIENFEKKDANMDYKSFLLRLGALDIVRFTDDENVKPLATSPAVSL